MKSSVFFKKIKPSNTQYLLIALALALGIGGISVGVVYGLNKKSETANTLNERGSNIENVKENIADTVVEERSTDKAPLNNDEPAGDSDSILPTPSKNNQVNQSAPTSSISTYDPDKCAPLKNIADGLKTESDNKYKLYINAQVSASSYENFYNKALVKYGIHDPDSTSLAKAEADELYNAQQTNITSLDNDWKNSLDSYNKAYSKYQDCLSKNVLGQ